MRLSLFGRVALILLVGLISAQLVTYWLQSTERTAVFNQARGLRFVDRVAETVRTLDATPSTQRLAVIQHLKDEGVDVSLIADTEVERFVPRGAMAANINARLGEQREIRAAGGLGRNGRMGNGNGRMGFDARATVDVRLSDGQWVRLSTDREAKAPAVSTTLIAQLLISILIVAAVAVIAVRYSTSPVKRLAEAANRLGDNLDASPLPEDGPPEMRFAAQAFNHMQSRIQRLISERARALAALSHDLRTPLTRLRLRTELVGDDELRDQLAADIETMGAMIESTLEYLRSLQENEPPRLIDINGLVQSLVEDMSVLGKTIRIEGSADAPYQGRLTALRRALQNLLDNARKYADDVAIVIRDDLQSLRIIIEDNGPGLPEAELDRVGQPFYRPDTARSSPAGGVGLGLSIVRDVAQLHGGTMTIANRPGGGLAVTLTLPRSQDSPAVAARR